MGSAPRDERESDAGVPVPPRAVKHVIAVEGGRGGVGASVVAVNLAVYLAQLGRRVALVDADPSGGQLHTMLGVMVDPTAPASDDRNESIHPVPTPVPGLHLVAQTYVRGMTVPVRPGRKPRWAKGMRHLDVDYVLLDLGASTAPSTLDLFLAADVGIAVTGPEPPSVEATYRFVRAAFQRRLRRFFVRDRFKMRLVERAQASLPALPAPIEFIQALARHDSSIGAIAAAELARIRPRLVVNGTRLRHDNDLGPAMCDMAERYLGAHLDYVGAIEHDDSVSLSVSRRRPLLIDSPTSKSARNIERIARRILALASSREGERPAPPVALDEDEPSLYDVLLLPRGATDEDLRRAYKRLREIYQPGSLPLTSLVSDDDMKSEQARIDEAHDTLLDPLRRRAYDVSMFPDEEEPELPPDPRLDAAIEAERSMLRDELTREINAETEFSGALLKKVRESQGTELSHIAERTKISMAHLHAIEDEAFDGLPALVYTRGFLQEIAKNLSLDPAQVSKTYLKRIRDWKRTTEGTT